MGAVLVLGLPIGQQTPGYQNSNGKSDKGHIAFGHLYKWPSKPSSEEEDTFISIFNGGKCDITKKKKCCTCDWAMRVSSLICVLKFTRQKTHNNTPLCAAGISSKAMLWLENTSFWWVSSDSPSQLSFDKLLQNIIKHFERRKKWAKQKTVNPDAYHYCLDWPYQYFNKACYTFKYRDCTYKLF